MNLERHFLEISGDALGLSEWIPCTISAMIGGNVEAIELVTWSTFVPWKMLVDCWRLKGFEVLDVFVEVLDVYCDFMEYNRILGTGIFAVHLPYKLTKCR